MMKRNIGMRKPFIALMLLCVGFGVGWLCLIGSIVLDVVRDDRDPTHLRIPFYGTISLAPEVATQDMLRNRGSIDGFQVQSSRPWIDGQQLVVYHCTLSPWRGGPVREEFGFAIVKKHRGGWLAYDGIMYPSVPAPSTVSYAGAERDGKLIVYGQAIDKRATTVVIHTDTGKIMQEQISNGGFTLVVPNAQSVVKVQVLDQQNVVLEEYQQSQQALREQ